MDWKELPDVKNGNKLPPNKLKEAEAELLLTHIPDKSFVFFLDEIGKTFNSVKFSEHFQKKSIEFSKIVFVKSLPISILFDGSYFGSSCFFILIKMLLI